MDIEIKMPRLGLTMKQGTIQEWYKSEGEYIEKGEALCLIASEKLTSELEAPADGFLVMRVPLDEMIAINTVIAEISPVKKEQDKEKNVETLENKPLEIKNEKKVPVSVLQGEPPINQEFSSTSRTQRAMKEDDYNQTIILTKPLINQLSSGDNKESEPLHNDVPFIDNSAIPRTGQGDSNSLTSDNGYLETPLTGDFEQPHEPIEVEKAPLHEESLENQQQEDIQATPIARRMAKKFGIDLATIKGTGGAGRIVKEDVKRARNELKNQQNSILSGHTTDEPLAEKLEEKYMDKGSEEMKQEAIPQEPQEKIAEEIDNTIASQAQDTASIDSHAVVEPSAIEESTPYEQSLQEVPVFEEPTVGLTSNIIEYDGVEEQPALEASEEQSALEEVEEQSSLEVSREEQAVPKEEIAIQQLEQSEAVAIDKIHKKVGKNMQTFNDVQVNNTFKGSRVMKKLMKQPIITDRKKIITSSKEAETNHFSSAVEKTPQAATNQFAQQYIQETLDKVKAEQAPISNELNEVQQEDDASVYADGEIKDVLMMNKSIRITALEAFQKQLQKQLQFKKKNLEVSLEGLITRAIILAIKPHSDSDTVLLFDGQQEKHIAIENTNSVIALSENLSSPEDISVGEANTDLFITASYEELVNGLLGSNHSPFNFEFAYKLSNDVSGKLLLTLLFAINESDISRETGREILKDIVINLENPMLLFL